LCLLLPLDFNTVHAHSHDVSTSATSAPATCPVEPGYSDAEASALVGPDLWDTFASEEQACMRRKIKKLHAEGYEGKQAIAIAMQHCAPGKVKSKHAVELLEAADAEDHFATLAHEYSVEKAPEGTVRVKDVPIFGENARTSFTAEALKYDAAWLKGAVKTDEKLRSERYSAPMHFGHHTFAGGAVERAGHYELTGVRKVKHLGHKKHVAFADLVFKSEAAFEKYRRDYPYRSVEISHERPGQINSLALLSSEAPFFQFPCGAHKFSSELTPGAQPKAHYFTWQAEVSEAFAGFPPAAKKKPPVKSPPKASVAPKYGEDEAAGQSDGADGMAATEDGAPPEHAHPPADAGTNSNDVVVENIHAMMELLNKLVDHVIAKDAHEDDLPAHEHDEPDGDEPEEHDPEHDGEKPVSDKDKNKNHPIVAAAAESAEVATLQGRIAALETELTRLTKERSNDAQFSTLRAELSIYGIPNLDAELRKHVTAGTAQSWADGIKSFAPPTKRPGEAPSVPTEDPAVTEYLAKHPKADPAVVREMAAVYAAAPEGHMIRNHKLDRFLAIQLEMGS
jgi:hypothetical protein